MKWLKRLLFVVVVLVTLVGLFYAVENWRGKNAWAQWQRAREAQGDRYEWSAVTPAPIPDAENVAAAPIFAELFPKPPAKPRLDQVRLPAIQNAFGNWRLGVHTDTNKWQAADADSFQQLAPILREIESALERPRCRFPVRYEDNFSALLPHLTYLRNAARTYSVLSCLSVSEASHQYTRICLRLADLLKEEPVLISHLVREAILEHAFQPAWEGLVAHRWNEQQLASLQADLAHLNECEQVVTAIQGERRFSHGVARWLKSNPRQLQILGNTGLDRAMAVVPAGWFDQNLLRVDRFYVEHLLPTIDARHKRVDAAAVKQLDRFLAGRPGPYDILARLLLPAVQTVPRRAAMIQTAVDQVAVACALERFRLARGELPNTLDALMPTYLPAVPRDVIDGQPLRYRREGLDKFVLWSVGWNEADDGGTIARNGERLDDTKGDWVWKSN